MGAVAARHGQPAHRSLGRFCAQGQRGDIWFLAGNLDGTPASPIKRSCTIPAGKALFFPLVNAFSGYLIGADPADQDSVAAQREIVRTFGVHASAGLSVTVDGRPAPFRFEESVPFTVVLPIDNVYGLTDHFLLYPTVDAGYYSYLPPLCPGTHRLVFTGRLPGKPMLRVMYQLTIRR